MTTPSSSRSGADRCPGLLTPFASADGAMIRLRLPGGRVEAPTLAEISSLAGRFGDPRVTLTSRGSLQLRGLPDPLPRELIAAIGDLALVPSGEHDKARNIIADPGAGIDDLVGALDRALLDDAALAGLPGRFLLAVAEPGGPVLAEPWDIAIVDETEFARVVVDGRCVVVAREQAPGAALDVARRFLVARGDERTWNVRDLPPRLRAGMLPGGSSFAVEAAQPPAPGPVGDDLVAVVPLGLLTAEMAEALTAFRGSRPRGRSHLNERTVAEARRPPGPEPRSHLNHHPVAEARRPPGPEPRSQPDRLGGSAVDGLAPQLPLVITPWRSVLVPGGAAHADELAGAGFVTAPDSPWSLLTACVGAPACARTDTATRDLARAAAPFIDPSGPPVHVIGCERGCGRPAREHATALNPTSAADIARAQRSPLEKA